MKLIQRAVWSFWTKPYQAHRNQVWFSDKHHLLSWILSVETARKFFSETVLVTDDIGLSMLVDGLGINFDEVSTDLNVLNDSDPNWWVLGKLRAYQAQTKPFIHLDNDVFLWKALPEKVDTASVFTQNSEYFVFGQSSIYRPNIFTQKIMSSQNGWLPNEWKWFLERQGNWGFCCGILGGNHVDFIRHYSSLALKIVENTNNQIALKNMTDKKIDSILLEQYFLAACLEYHKSEIDPSYKNLYMQCLFESVEDAFNPHKAEEVGYTHLIADAKRDIKLAHRLEQRVSKDFPDLYKKCLHYLQNNPYF
jgi:hypothetical protein